LINNELFLWEVQMKLKMIALAALLLAEGSAWAGTGERIAVCATARTAAHKYEVFQMYVASNTYKYFLRGDDGQTVALIGPDERTTFNPDRTQIFINFGPIGVILMKGVNKPGVLRGMLVPEEQIICNSNWR
jgi:hypothetical protein